jgi:hypothetical protein
MKLLALRRLKKICDAKFKKYINRLASRVHHHLTGPNFHLMVLQMILTMTFSMISRVYFHLPAPNLLETMKLQKVMRIHWHVQKGKNSIINLTAAL